MKNYAKKEKKLYTILAFLIPMLGFIFLMIIKGYIPFGKASILYCDEYHQYYPFFLTFRRKLLEGKSLLYLWDVGMGTDYIGIISYYLASPFNLLGVLVPEGLTLQYFSLISPVKLGFAGLFFSIFLKKLFGKNDFSISLFGSLYALCAWALGYQWNVMWLDTFALLPLVVLGEVYLLRDKKVRLYTITLFLAILMNYYIGLFVCIFVALVFICYEICRQKTAKCFVFDFGRIALFSVIAIGMTAFLELPAFLSLQRTQSANINFPFGFYLNFADKNTILGLFDAMRQVAGNMNGGSMPNLDTANALPNIYCGIIANIFAFLYLVSKDVKLKDKICSVSLLLFLNLSCVIRMLDYIWHGFHFTNMIPYRFSFLYSFVLLYMAYSAFTLRSTFNFRQIIIAGILSVMLFLIGGFGKGSIVIVYNPFFIFLYMVVLLYPFFAPSVNKIVQKCKHCIGLLFNRKIHLYNVVFSLVIILEICAMILRASLGYVGSEDSEFLREKENTATVVSYMKEQNESSDFYRTEVTKYQTMNDGALNGYNGITAFTSSADYKTVLYMQSLGFRVSMNSCTYDYGSPVSNLFSNIKYMLERDGNKNFNPYFTDIYKQNDVQLLKNNAYLPLGFLADSEILNIDFDNIHKVQSERYNAWNRLDFQNELFTSATGISTNVWDLIANDKISVSATDMKPTISIENGYRSYFTDEKKSGLITYKYNADKAGYLCFDLSFKSNDSLQHKKINFTVLKNDEILYSQTYEKPQIFGVSNIAIGDEIKLKIECNPNTKGRTRVYAAVLNDEIFKKGYNILSASTLKLTEFKDTYISGKVDCDRDGVLYTSIPQNGNWFAYVDGKSVESVAFAEAMVTLPLSKGSHTVTFEYRNRAFYTGFIISITSLAAFLIIFFVVYSKKNYKSSTKNV